MNDDTQRYTQCEYMLKIMYENRFKKSIWYAKDFQRVPYFIGYEATARMSDLKRMYPTLFIVGKDGRFRTLQLDLTQEKAIIDILKSI